MRIRILDMFDRENTVRVLLESIENGEQADMDEVAEALSDYREMLRRIIEGATVEV